MSMSVSSYFNLNQKAWDERAKVHFDSQFYDVNGFMQGKSSLTEIESSELTEGEVKGKKMLHLQCHFGLDSLSWARLGAKVTGVDFSEPAINKARELNHALNLDACFICSDVYSFGEKAKAEFDIVFTSFGTICWLPCIDTWAEVIADSLKSGGCFYMAEFHPIRDFLAGESYFYAPAPFVCDEGTYTENGDGTQGSMASWSHPLSRVITALINAGIKIDKVNEFPFSPYDCFDGLEEREPKRFSHLVGENPLPLVYSIKGTKN
jgi:SAM-dependent methyltransferase